MSEEQAKRLLDSLKGDEKAMPMTAQNMGAGRQTPGPEEEGLVMKNLQKITGEKVITLRRIMTAGARMPSWRQRRGGDSFPAAARPVGVAEERLARLPTAIFQQPLNRKILPWVKRPSWWSRFPAKMRAPPELSPVDGLRFYTMGRSSQYQSINGRVSATTSYLFQVQAEHAGDFVIPPVEANIDGKHHKSEPVTLRVARGTPRQSGRGALPPSNSPPQSRGFGSNGA